MGSSVQCDCYSCGSAPTLHYTTLFHQTYGSTKNNKLNKINEHNVLNILQYILGTNIDCKICSIFFNVTYLSVIVQNANLLEIRMVEFKELIHLVSVQRGYLR